MMLTTHLEHDAPPGVPSQQHIQEDDRVRPRVGQCPTMLALLHHGRFGSRRKGGGGGGEPVCTDVSSRVETLQYSTVRHQWRRTPSPLAPTGLR